ncbi:uncharacterized protein LOC125501956 [Athalia rosae]|uniref:uncharacterized protein LOC125501956 n=1 Tax=Athalia rosae TaxID=37344 RepID=UPI0020337F76|nr:uncharacterized protein LOC125501956 [Athalia rosae]
MEYPSLQSMVRSEGVCPVCYTGVSDAPKFQCENGHSLCHRCKPHYNVCPTCCSSTLDFVQPPNRREISSPRPFHPMPHPPRAHAGTIFPSAPHFDLTERERGACGGPPPPESDGTLVPCGNSNYGCWVAVPEYLRDTHETRCQYRPFLEEESLPTDIVVSEGLVNCAHRVVGCNVAMPPWRKAIHEASCVYKERFEVVERGEDTSDDSYDGGDEDDPEEMVECKLKIYGCSVKMPRRRKIVHEEKCNYNKCYREEDFEIAAEDEAPEDKMTPEDGDPESPTDCRWAEYGCRVRPKAFRKETHEEKCNYKMEECRFADNGCEELFTRSRKFAHERNCQFRDSD